MNSYYFKEILKCEMCGSPNVDHKVLGQRLNRSQGFNPKKKTGISVAIQKCENCKLIYSNPQPIPFDIHDHYGIPPEDYWKPDYFKWNSNYFSTQIHTVKSLLNFKKGMKALDIGAGIGKAMLSLENAGFETYGLEPSEPFYERALSEMKIDGDKLSLGKIEELDYEFGYFDFISFGAVFEHLYEPSKCLDKALRWLKKDGIIHIEVPSSKWLLARLINAYYKMIGTNFVTNLSPMHTPYHLYEFDINTFRKISYSKSVTIDKYYYSVCNIFYFPKFLHPLLSMYMKKTNTGMQLTLYLRKVTES